MTYFTQADLLITLVIIGCASYISYRVGYSKGWKECIRRHFQPREKDDEP